MFLRKIKSEGIAHLSYMIGSQGAAAVIDPRRDIDVYLEIAREESVNITHIFETHRNEDYVIGSIPLAERTGAQIHHGHALDFAYGDPVKEGDAFRIGDMELRILETPGHTFESISIALFDTASGDIAVGVFTGDALFISDVGRTDFFPDRAKEVAGLLYDSIFEKILPLGDQTILYPAHGAGSVCGSGMAAREFSTLGYERRNNPVLQKTDRREFVEYKINEEHEQPPYFRTMEKFNQQGPPRKERPEYLPALTPEQLHDAQQNGLQVVDTRSPEAVAGALIPGSIALPLNMLPAFAGWFLSYDRPIGLVIHSTDEVETAVRHLYRIGYDDIAGYLVGGLHAWEVRGKAYQTIPAIHAVDLTKKIEDSEDFLLLDVRSPEEYRRKHLPDAHNVYVGHLPEHLDELDRSRKIVTFCGSGQRALIAAALLKAAGFEDVENCFGSMKACAAVGCPVA
ncbi:MAG: MBL fold metallo-hydrolase [Phycisphaerae bacterium]|nr:MBL fold metallo-hydrolase [Phycisphaerae bacterium]